MVLHPSRRPLPQAVTGTKHDRHSTAVKVGSGHANGSFGAILRHTPSGSGVAPKAEHEPWQATMPGLSLHSWHYGVEPCASCCAVPTVPFRSRAPVMLQEHPDRLFDYVLFRNGYALATRHPGPQRQLVEHPHELVSRKLRIAAVQDAHRSQMREIAHEPLGLRLHDGGELLGDPGELAGVGHHHAEKPEVFRVLVEPQNHARDQAQHVLDLTPGLDAGRKCVLELTRHPEEHLPEDLLLACELIVERPPGDAGGLRQLVHRDGAEAPLQEQTLGRFDDRLTRAAAPRPRNGLVRTLAIFHQKALLHHIVHIIMLYCEV